jgi:putative endonuclease
LGKRDGQKETESEKGKKNKGNMPIFSRMIFGVVRWVARKGLRDERRDLLECAAADGNVMDGGWARVSHAMKETSERKLQARRTGVRGETYAYWYLRRHGYVFVARNYTPRGAKGEIDLIGYEGKTLAFVEVRTRTVRQEFAALPELSITAEKQHAVKRTARRFLGERHMGDCPCRFDVLAIDNRPGMPPAVRLHKDAFSPQM